ncbi:MAG: orotate phosphoribosyltransferase [Eubacteriales bacterium]|jgi:orotate phosphoribosyltransferase|nr:orotate phosphoribosyltransferase [Clostridiales bacterium]
MNTSTSTSTNAKTKRRIAEALLSIGAVFFRPNEPFVWVSGIKSPVYCDNRLTLSDVTVRSEIEYALADTMRENYPDAEMLMGTSTAGIPHAAIAAHILGLSMGYVRASAKGHGRNNHIEGKLTAGMKTVVIEDLISTGGSVLDAVDVLRGAGADVVGVASIFTYNMNISFKRLSAAGVKNISLTDFDTIVDTAIELGYIKPEDVKKLIAFRDNPADEGWINI